MKIKKRFSDDDLMQALARFEVASMFRLLADGRIGNRISDRLARFIVYPTMRVPFAMVAALQQLGWLSNAPHTLTAEVRAALAAALDTAELGPSVRR